MEAGPIFILCGLFLNNISKTYGWSYMKFGQSVDYGPEEG